MKMVYTSQNATLVHNYKNILEGAGIRCELKNENLQIGLGEVPVLEAWVELWVEDDAEYEDALAFVMDGATPEEAAAGAWKCPKCGEELEGQFTACWSCGTTHETG